MIAMKSESIESMYTKDVNEIKEDHIGFFKKHNIVWRNVIFLATVHLLSVYACYKLILGQCYFSTVLFTTGTAILCALATTVGSHKLWSHRSFKANVPLRLILAFFASMAFQNSAFTWARDHRVHHRYSETNADPHNAKRGFFFSHVGWLMVRKHKDVIEKGKLVDISDLEKDRILMFFHRIHNWFGILIAFVIPPLITWYCFGETFWASFVFSVLRFALLTNLIWSVNSAAHIYGVRPYDKNIGATQNSLLMAIGLGEGCHNYHHTFPWDYRSSEYTAYTNPSADLIVFFKNIGWATDLKMATPEIVRKRAKMTGDQTRELFISDIPKFSYRAVEACR